MRPAKKGLERVLQHVCNPTTTSFAFTGHHGAFASGDLLALIASLYLAPLYALVMLIVNVYRGFLCDKKSLTAFLETCCGQTNTPTGSLGQHTGSHHGLHGWLAGASQDARQGRCKALGTAGQRLSMNSVSQPEVQRLSRVREDNILSCLAYRTPGNCRYWCEE